MNILQKHKDNIDTMSSIIVSVPSDIAIWLYTVVFNCLLYQRVYCIDYAHIQNHEILLIQSTYRNFSHKLLNVDRKKKLNKKSIK